MIINDSVTAGIQFIVHADCTLGDTGDKVGFLGATAIVRPTVAAAATDAATTQTLVNNIRTALLNLGLAA